MILFSKTKKVGLYIWFVIRIIFDVIGPAFYGFTTIRTQIKPLLFLNDVVLFIYVIKFGWDCNLDNFSRFFADFPAKTLEISNPLLVVFCIQVSNFLLLFCATFAAALLEERKTVKATPTANKTDNAATIFLRVIFIDTINICSHPSVSDRVFIYMRKWLGFMLKF